MRIGKQDAPFTAISTSDATSITVRGRDLCRDLIGKIDFADYFFLMLMGQAPTQTQSFFVNALLVAIAEHGLVPSVQAARMTLAAAPEAVQGAVAAGLLGSGSVVLGSAETAGYFLHGLVEASKDADPRDVALGRVKQMKAAKTAIRASAIPSIRAATPAPMCSCATRASRASTAGPTSGMLHTVAEVLPEGLGRALPININGVIPAILLKIGFPVSATKSISILARTAGLLAHLQEETVRSIGFVMSDAAAEAITYDGAAAPAKG